LHLLVSDGKVKVKVTLEKAMKAQRGSRSVAYSFFNLSARWKLVVNATLPPPPLETTQYAYEAGWGFRGAENLAPPHRD